jgi:hypothetical protein
MIPHQQLRGGFVGVEAVKKAYALYAFENVDNCGQPILLSSHKGSS